MTLWALLICPAARVLIAQQHATDVGKTCNYSLLLGDDVMLIAVYLSQVCSNRALQS